jgi:CTP:molybdopterin cytidylyltransferase MocA
LILAGGAGSRFGGPKAWALLPDGRTFVQACTASLRAAGADPVLATLPPGSNDPQIEGLVVIPLPEPGLDMFASLRIGLRRLVGEEGWNRVALLPVDHPLVRPRTVTVLAVSTPSAVIPSYRGKRGHPVVIDRATAEMIASDRLAGPTLREVLRGVGAVDLEVDDPGTVANCNTPGALETAWRSVG